MVLHTKARQEKAVARFLSARDVRYFLPLIDRVSMNRGRRFVSRVPLFSGYVFFSGDLEDGYAAISARRVCSILQVANQERFLDELEQIRLALARGAELYKCPFAVVGVRCRVIKGPFEGIEGVVSQRLRANRLALQINALGQGVVLEIDADLLEPIG